jgi:hypothetical protein
MKYDPLIEQVLAGPALLRGAIAGTNSEQLLAKPIAGKWSTLEVVCHIADYEPINADRMKRVIALEEPELPTKAYPAAGKTQGTIHSDLGLPDDQPTQEMFRFLGRVLKK